VNYLLAVWLRQRDLVEARIAAQIIPARIELEIAV
jgi:hypothetical protein